MKTYLLFPAILLVFVLQAQTTKNAQTKSWHNNRIIKTFYQKLDAAIHLEKYRKNYLFKAGQYIRLSDKTANAGYPSNVHNSWQDLPQYWKTGIDAALRYTPKHITLLFKDREYVLFQHGKSVVDVPQKLPGLFKKLPRHFHSNIDAGGYLPERDRIYLFKGKQYVRIRPQQMVVEETVNLPGEWKGLPQDFWTDLDATLYSHGKTYFFKNGWYVRFTGMQMDEGFPRKMTTDWKLNSPE